MLNMAWKRLIRRLHYIWHQVKRQPKDDLNATSLPVQGGIYMSIHLKPNCHFVELPYTMMVAAAIVKAIQRLTGINTEIKWVNDTLLGQTKKWLVSLLKPLVLESGRITDVIIGIGLTSITDFP